ESEFLNSFKPCDNPAVYRCHESVQNSYEHDWQSISDQFNGVHFRNTNSELAPCLPNWDHRCNQITGCVTNKQAIETIIEDQWKDHGGQDHRQGNLRSAEQ